MHNLMNCCMGICEANKDPIIKAIDAFVWDKRLLGRCINDLVLLFNETLLHIISSFIPNKKIFFDDSEPPQFDRKIKNLIKYKNDKDKTDHKSNHNDILKISSTEKTNQAKRKNCEKMSQFNPKKYQSLLKALLNGQITQTQTQSFLQMMHPYFP